MKISIVMPVYNEKETLEKITSKVLSINNVLELIIVDDRSTDGSREIITKLEDLRIVKILSEKNSGKGASLR
ncbi:MAG: glycosyltransferase, partial [Candidatus Aureabacteria bacterium]|nr:glycosyltransferase [Candidatus Auribacterota bacterium]